MKINAQELLLINKNFKAGEAEPQAPVPTTEPTTTNPQATMRALELQGKNNMAFYGLQTSTVVNGAKKTLLPLIAALSLGLASCSEDPIYIEKEPVHVEVETNVTVDLGQLDAILTFIQKMYEQQQLTYDQMVLMNQNMAAWLEAYKNNEMSANELMNKMYELMLLNTANQEVMIQLLTQNGKSQEEAIKYIQELIKEVKDGKLTAAEAYAKLLAEIGNINNLLKDIFDVLQGLWSDFNKFQQQYKNAEYEEFKLLTEAIIQGKVNASLIEKLVNGQAIMNDNIEKMRINTDSMLGILKDDEKFNQLMAELKSIDRNTAEFKNIEEYFNQFGIDIKEISAENREAIIKAIENFKLTYINVESGQTALMKEINSKLDILYNFPGLDQSDLIDAVKDLQNSVDENTESVNAVNAKLDELHNALKAIYGRLGDAMNQASVYKKLYLEKFDAMLAKMDAFATDFDGFQNSYDITNALLKDVIAKEDEIKVDIKNLVDAARGGMTIEEFIAYMEQCDASNAEKVKKYLEENGYNNLPADVTEIKDLLAKINEKTPDKSEYMGQIKRIICLLGDIDWSLQENNAKLDEIKELIKNFKCNCECGGNSDVNEGIIEDLEDILKK